MKYISKKTLKLWCKVFLTTLFVMLLVRVFLFQAYTVSSVQMEASLLKGDRVLVNKMEYGLRMPITPLVVPFSFDSILGGRSYSRAIELGYHRLFARQVKCNDVVVFNNPLEIEKPLDRRSLCLSRCIAGPGDTIQVSGFDFQINGKSYIMSPNRLLEFSYPRSESDTLLSIMKKLHIEGRNFRRDSSAIYFAFNRYEAFLLKQNLSKPVDSLRIVTKETDNYKFLIPKQGEQIRLTDENIPFYRSIVLREQGLNARFDGSQLYIANKTCSVYRFNQNYYWLLSDNVEESLDSRYIGMISDQDIIGKASLVLFSYDKNRKHTLESVFCLYLLMMIYLSSAYLPPIQYFSKLLTEGICIECYDNYVKQSYRNRCNILSANGVITLSVPIKKTETSKCLMKDVRISEHGHWQHLHWNALVSAYNSTPFFEFFKDDFYPIYHTKYDFLFDFNEALRILICNLIGIDSDARYTDSYQFELSGGDTDLRNLIHPKRDWVEQDFKNIPYYQVFSQRFGFVENLSIVDLVFNMGNESLIILGESIKK